ncbi:TrlF family AAA-like ATPase [uncultured Paludibaculum sp.]|uniref:TrlF family AAA-like ATPase n=1 Tax=uncultured Paludibaculum sp. TaxID=1765020 RepID=UPI002AABFEA2|nr:hypothetical protein [uncultured Paludibaculum sp.]
MKQAEWKYPGARWWKFDFHTHTPASKCSKWQGLEGSAGEVTPRQWLLKFMQAEVDCVAITDHNTGEWVDRLKEAYDVLARENSDGFRALHLFPGVELSVNGGVHLLVVLDKDKSAADIDMLLGKVDYQGSKGDSDGVTGRSLADVLDAVRVVDGLAIPAHADREKGLLRLADPASRRALLDPNTLRAVLRSKTIAAIEIVDRSASKPQIYADERCDWTEVIGSDCHSFRGTHCPGSRFTWVKMANPSLEGLRLALMDGEKFSIRRSDDADAFSPLDLPSQFVTSIEIADARYMGRGKSEKLTLSPWFNALVGGRGTGKSTIVHALRLAYRREAELKRLPEEDGARRTFEQFIRVPVSRNDESGALDYQATKRTKIKVSLVRNGIEERLIWNQDGSGHAVEELEGGEWVPGGSQAVSHGRFQIRIFSQGQIAALAGENQRALLQLITEAAQVQPTIQAKEEAEHSFLSLRARIRELDGKLRGREDLLGRLADVQRKLVSFEGQQHAEILKEYQLRARQSREVDRQLEAASHAAQALGQQAELLVGESVPPGLFDPNAVLDAEALGVVERLHGAISEAARVAREGSVRLSDVVANERIALASTEWFLKSVEARTRYEELSQLLKGQGVSDPGQYGILVQIRQNLEQEIERLDSIQKERERLEEASSAALTLVRQARREISTQRKAFLQATLAQNRYVRIELQPFGRNPSAIERELREVLGVLDDRFEEDILHLEDDQPKKGLVAELLRNPPEDWDGAQTFAKRCLFSFGERLEQAASGRGGFSRHFSNFIQREVSRTPEFLDRLLLWSPEDSLLVEYSQKGDGRDFKPIQQASAGQRAAAMLAFLLLHGEEPLVLDQPEDDLDNHLIYELVVQQIRDKKLERQLIVVTHNPNIVVNGDAEMVHVLDFRSGQCRLVLAGSLQQDDIREEVCRVMEGGREAFKRRYRRIGGPGTDV